jgi:hypothetical protein
MSRNYQLTGSVVWSGLLAQPPAFARASRLPRNAARKLGVKYELQVQEYLDRAYPGQYVPSPWLAYRVSGESQTRYCQPDGLLFDWPRHSILVVEIKYQHTADAFEQVQGLYLPVLQNLFQRCGFQFRRCEIVKWYDPARYFPCPVAMVSDPLLTPANKFGVFIWKKRSWMDELGV